MELLPGWVIVRRMLICCLQVHWNMQPYIARNSGDSWYIYCGCYIPLTYAVNNWSLIFWLKMEDLGHSFQSRKIQQMELALLEALGWRLGSPTAYSYVELLMRSIDSLKPHVHEELTTRVTGLLLGAISGICILFIWGKWWANSIYGSFVLIELPLAPSIYIYCFNYWYKVGNKPSRFKIAGG